jgi:CPA1 family monovalent cation:H+ antiporter
MFGTLLNIAVGGHNMTAANALLWFARETIGGITFGLLIGLLAYSMIRSIDDYQVEVLISLALVVGGYTLAMHLGVSGPLAMVAAGLLMGKHGRKFAISNYTQQYVDKFWEMIDEILNVVLFVLIGFEVLALTFTHQYLLAAMLLIPVVLLVRLVCVGIPIQLMRWRLRLDCPHAIKILTWAGVRGGISVALALSLPAVPEREIIVAITYTVVVFSILVQGLTMEKVVKAAVKVP